MEAVHPRDWHPALIVVDVQNKFYRVTEGLHRSVDLCIGEINRAISSFRDSGLPIAFVAFDGHVEGCMDDGPDADGFIDALDVVESDHVIHKTQMNCFKDSELKCFLESNGCDSIVLVGLVAHLCVLSTYYDAFNLGFKPYMLKGALAATDQDNVVHVEAITQTLDNDTLRSILGLSE